MEIKEIAIFLCSISITLCSFLHLGNTYFKKERNLYAFSPVLPLLLF